MDLDKTQCDSCLVRNATLGWDAPTWSTLMIIDAKNYGLYSLLTWWQFVHCLGQIQDITKRDLHVELGKQTQLKRYTNIILHSRIVKATA